MKDKRARGLAAYANSADGISAALDGVVSRPLAEGFTWDADYPLAPTLRFSLNQKVVGDAGYSPFNQAAYAACRAGTTKYIAASGNDTTGDGSFGNPWRTPNKAATEMNLLGLTSGTIVQLAGTYTRTGGGVFTVVANFHLAWVASGGAVGMGTNDSYTWSQNTTTFPSLTGRPNLWAIARSSFGRADNPSLVDSYGNTQEYITVGSLDKANALPGSVYSDGTNVFVFPHNGADATNSTVRVFLDQSCILFQSISSPKHLFITGDTDDDYFIVNGSFYVSCSAIPADKHFLALRNFQARMSKNTTQQNSLAVEGWHGLVYIERGSGAQSGLDLLNMHNVLGATMSVLTVNCSGIDAGRGSGTSCNDITGHDTNLSWVDIAGDWSCSRGGTAAFVGESQLNAIGSRFAKDFGDEMLGGSIKPTVIRVLDDGMVFLDTCSIEPQNKSDRAFSAPDTGYIFTRNMDVTSLVGGDLVTEY